MIAHFLVFLPIFLWSNAGVATGITVDRNDYFYSLSECDGAPLDCWTAPSTYRFSSETENVNPFAAATRSGLRLSAAANEFEAFQVAMKSTSSNALQMTAELSEFTPSLGSPSERRVELHTVPHSGLPSFPAPRGFADPTPRCSCHVHSIGNTQ